MGSKQHLCEQQQLERGLEALPPQVRRCTASAAGTYHCGDAEGVVFAVDNGLCLATDTSRLATFIGCAASTACVTITAVPQPGWPLPASSKHSLSIGCCWRQARLLNSVSILDNSLLVQAMLHPVMHAVLSVAILDGIYYAERGRC